MIPICPVVSFTYGEYNVPAEVPAQLLARPGAAGRRGGWGWLRGGGGGRHPGVRVSERVRGGRGRRAAAARAGRERPLTAPLSLLLPPSVSLPLRASSPAMGPDSPCPPQCPAGWGKMPKWRPATTLDSPTAGRRRRRLRPSIGNGALPPPSLPLPAPPLGSRRRDAPAPAPARRPGAPARGRPASRPLPAPGGTRPPIGRDETRRGRGLGTWRAAGAFGGPAAKMASRGPPARRAG